MANNNRLSYFLGGLSYIPLIGVIFGIISIINGIVKIKRDGIRYIILGSGGIIFTILIYSGLYYFGIVHRGGLYDKLTIKLVENNLIQIVRGIEYNKMIEGKYPKNLNELESKNKEMYIIFDPILAKINYKGEKLYHYELINNDKNFILFSIGFDGIPFTNDDILPKLNDAEKTKIGYRDRELKKIKYN